MKPVAHPPLDESCLGQIRYLFIDLEPLERQWLLRKCGLKELLIGETGRMRPGVLCPNAQACRSASHAVINGVSLNQMVYSPFYIRDLTHSAF